MRVASGTPGQQEIPEYPALFSKNPATVTGPESNVLYPAPHSEQLDWGGRACCDHRTARPRHQREGRDAARPGLHLRERRFGARRTATAWRSVVQGKEFRYTPAMGPWIVTADELDASAVRVRTRRERHDEAGLEYEIHGIQDPAPGERVSAGCRLQAGDIIITGTPEGVGFARKPPEFMKPGDVVEVEIDGIGVLRNRVHGRM